MKTEAGTYLKDQIKTLLIAKPNQKIRFQVRHPENAIRLVGIAVSCNAYTLKEFALIKGKTAGHLSLIIAEKGDVAFGEDVTIDNNQYRDITEKRCWFEPMKSLSKIGKRLSYFETDYTITQAIMEGYYEDVFLNSVSLSASGAIVSVATLSPNPLYLQANDIYLPVVSPVVSSDATSLQSLSYNVTIYFKYQIKN
jgi:hypothetical protein